MHANAHIFPGPAIVKALHESANSAVAANNSTIRTEITGGDGNGYFASGFSMDASSEDTLPVEFARQHLELPNLGVNHGSSRRKGSVVSVKTEISTSTEYMSPPLSSSGHILRHPISADYSAMNPPLARGLLLLAQMSSKDNLFTEVYTQRCLEMAREDPSFVLGFIAQEALNREPGDNFLVMTPGVSMPPSTVAGVHSPVTMSPSASRHRQQHAGRQASAAATGGDNLGQQYNMPRKVIVENGVDIVIVGRGLYKADDPAFEAERYRREAWSAYLERINEIAE